MIIDNNKHHKKYAPYKSEEYLFSCTLEADELEYLSNSSKTEYSETITENKMDVYYCSDLKRIVLAFSIDRNKSDAFIIDIDHFWINKFPANIKRKLKFTSLLQ
jgi:hypothetical protein